MEKFKRIVEICTSEPLGIEAAVRGGADRIELCSALEVGGITPSPGLIRHAVPRIRTNVLIRPRPGDFLYTEKELDVMASDIRMARDQGAAGVVFGALTEDGKVDKAACRRLLSEAEGMDTTFHRAFDVAADPFEALEDIIELGFKRILTSGQARSAEEGMKLIEELNRRADGRIVIMAGAGIDPDNAAIVMRTGVKEIHASGSSRFPSRMKRSGKATMGAAEPIDGSRMATDEWKVSGICNAIKA